MGGFRHGFRSRNPLILVCAALLLVPALLGFEWLFTSGVWTAVPLNRALRNPEDSFAYISWTVGKARRDRPDGPGLYLLGGSSARESIVSGEALADEIEALGGPRVAAYDLGSINQNFAESMAVLESVPDTPAWLLVGVNLGRFTPTRERSAMQAQGREFLLRSDAVRSFVAARWGLGRYRFTILPGVWAFITDWTRRHGAALLSGDPPSTRYRLHRYSAKTRRSDAQKRRMVEKWNATRRPVFERNRAANLELLEALLEKAHERGLNVVLLELPFNADLVGDGFAASQRKYRVPVAELAERYGYPYLDLNQSVDIPSRDFQDLSHLIMPGRIVWQRALARELAPLLSAGDSGGSGG